MTIAQAPLIVDRTLHEKLLISMIPRKIIDQTSDKIAFLTLIFLMLSV
jgi:hypothetical protein